MIAETDDAPRIILPRPFPYQREVLDDAHRFKTLDVGRQAGKTTISGLAIFYGHGPIDPRTGQLMFQGALGGKQGYWIAPTYELADIAWRRIKEWLAPVWATLRKSDAKNSQWVEFPGGGRLGMRSADDPEKLVGDTVDFIVIDEAAKAKAGTWELSQVMLEVRNGQRMRGERPGGGWAFIISTPKGRNWFYREWKRGWEREDPDYKSWQLPSTVSPLFTPAQAERYRLEMTPYLYEREILARFTVADGTFFRRSWIQSAPLPTTARAFLSASLPLNEDARGEKTAAGQEEENHLVVGTWRHAGDHVVLTDVLRKRVAPAEIPEILSECGRAADAEMLVVPHMEPLASMAKEAGRALAIYEMDLLAVYDAPGPTDECERAGIAASAIKARRMRFREGADWLEDFLGEVFSFPDPEEERGCVEMISLAARVA